MDDEEKESRIDSMFENCDSNENILDEYKEFLEFLAWKKSRDKKCFE